MHGNCSPDRETRILADFSVETSYNAAVWNAENLMGGWH
jgi:hypothetical protein